MQLEGAVQLTCDQQPLAPPVVGIAEQGQKTFVLCGSSLQRHDRRLEGEAEARADVQRFKSLRRGQHFWARG